MHYTLRDNRFLAETFEITSTTTRSLSAHKSQRIGPWSSPSDPVSFCEYKSSPAEQTYCISPLDIFSKFISPD